MEKLTIDGVEHDIDDFSEKAKNTIRSLQFVEQQLQQRHNELAVADTARIGYLRELKSGLAQHKKTE